jgi:hypothetical protein
MDSSRPIVRGREYLHVPLSLNLPFTMGCRQPWREMALIQSRSIWLLMYFARSFFCHIQSSVLGALCMFSLEFGLRSPHTVWGKNQDIWLIVKIKWNQVHFVSVFECNFWGILGVQDYVNWTYRILCGMNLEKKSSTIDPVPSDLLASKSCCITCLSLYFWNVRIAFVNY